MTSFLLLAQLGWDMSGRRILKGLRRLLGGRKKRTDYETREQNVFTEDVRGEFVKLRKKGLGITVTTL